MQKSDLYKQARVNAKRFGVVYNKESGKFTDFQLKELAQDQAYQNAKLVHSKKQELDLQNQITRSIENTNKAERKRLRSIEQQSKLQERQARNLERQNIIFSEILEGQLPAKGQRGRKRRPHVPLARGRGDDRGSVQDGRRHITLGVFVRLYFVIKSE